MTAVIRVKRRRDEEPLDGLLINCKRAKVITGEDHETETSTVLQFAGTLENREDDIFEHIKTVPTKSEIEKSYKKHTVNITEKLRSKKLQDLKDSRFKVVNRFRSNIPESTSDEASHQECTIYDVEYDENQNTPAFADKTLAEPEYVYDLYYTNSDDLGDMDFEGYLGADELVYGSKRDNGIDEPGTDDDSEDSNAENYFTHDYPDEDDMESLADEDIVNAVENIDLDSENELSTDDEANTYDDDSEPYYDYLPVPESMQTNFCKRLRKFTKLCNNTNDVPEHDFYEGDIDPDESD